MMGNMSNYTYMTYLGSNDYLVGTLALIFSLRKVRSRYPLIVLISSNISDKAIKVLEKANVKTIKIKDVQLPVNLTQKNMEGNQANWSNTFSKLFVFGMTRFDKIVFIDSDMYVKENIDILFSKPHLSSCFAGGKFPTNKNWVRSLNSGLMVIVPKENEDKRLLRILNEKVLKENNKSKSAIGDQDIIHLGYPDWGERPELELNDGYNVFSLYEAYYSAKILKDTSVKIVHFVGYLKPWNQSLLNKISWLLELIKTSIKYSISPKFTLIAIKDYIGYCHICTKVEEKIKC